MSKSATITVRIDQKTKEDAERIIDSLGLSVSTAIDLYYKQIALKGGIPFPLTVESKETTNQNS